jgi:pimeloyl-ACP methyl ester carboxylesterase
LAEDLAARGIATLRYDKRMVGASAAPQSEAELRFDDFVSDALALAKQLQSDPRFTSVSIIGHSEGSLIAMLVAQRDPALKSVVSLAGAGRDAATIIEEQVRDGGASPAVLAEVAATDKSLRNGETVLLPDPDLAALFRPSVQPYLISWYRYDPAAELAKVTVPVLIVQGTTDIQVGTTDARRLAAADPRAELLIVPGMNHILRDAPADRVANIATYTQPQLPLDESAVKAIAAFLR